VIWEYLAGKLLLIYFTLYHYFGKDTSYYLTYFESCRQAITFFGIIQCIYTLFAKSTKRWKFFVDNVPGLTVKSWSNTRWESIIKSVQAIKYQTPQIRSALKALEEMSALDNDPSTVSDCQSLVSALENFEFLVGLVIWHDILFFINKVSKKLQTKIVSIDATLKHIEGVITYFKKYRDEGFTYSMDTAKIISSELDVEPIFPTKRKGKRNKHFDEQDDEDEEMQQSAIDLFKREYFLIMIDAAFASLTSRFEQMKAFDNVFGFLFNSGNLKSLDEVDLWSHCKIFAEKFTHENSSDVEINDFYSELKVLQVSLPDSSMSATEVLKFVMDAYCYANVTVAYRILLNVPVTVASAKRSFSKLKLLKNYLRSTMSQERFNGLVMCSIEKDIFDTIDFNTILNDFASKNARRSIFL
jgi:hypothetical protein